MLPVQLDDLHTLLCLGARPGDLESGCGGTVLKLLAQREGLAVHWVVLDVEDGRADEARAGAERMLKDAGARHLAVEPRRSGPGSADSADLQAWCERLGREVAPDLVLAPDRDDGRPDRRQLGRVAAEAFRDQLILEYEIPIGGGELGRPNVFVPLDEPTARRKVHAVVECFRSRRAEPGFAADTFWSLLCLRGLACNSPTRMAEGLMCRKMRLT